MSDELWAGTGDSTLPPTLTAALIRCFHIPHQLREESRVSIRACDWLRATFPSSHWSIVSQSAGAGDRNSSGSRALVPWPEPPTCSSVSTSPFPQLLRHKTQDNNSQAEGSDRRLNRLNEIFEAGAEQMWREAHCRNVVQHLALIIQYPALVSVPCGN